MRNAKCYPDDVMVLFFFPEGSSRGRKPKSGGKERLDKEASEKVAARFCRGDDDNFVCPEIAECLELALENGYDGVWGGTSESERIQIRKSRRAKKIA